MELSNPDQDKTFTVATNKNLNLVIHGIQATELTQAQAYSTILEHNPPEPRKETEKVLRSVKAAVRDHNGYAPTNEQIWKSIRGRHLRRRPKNSNLKQCMARG